MDKNAEFENERKQNLLAQGENKNLVNLGLDFMLESLKTKYSYNFTWMGRPIIQYPQDIVAMQEIIFEVKPDIIIETGVAHGGSLIFYASMLELLGKGEVVGIDIDIREHNRAEILKHPMSKRIKLIQGSSTDPEVVAQVEKHAKGKQSVLVVLDSNHTHEHVYNELKLYSGFVSLNNYLVVFDTVIEDFPAGKYTNRPWDKGDNPKTAVKQFLKEDTRFKIDETYNAKLMVTVAPDGYLKRVK